MQTQTVIQNLFTAGRFVGDRHTLVLSVALDDSARPEPAPARIPQSVARDYIRAVAPKATAPASLESNGQEVTVNAQGMESFVLDAARVQFVEDNIVYSEVRAVPDVYGLVVFFLGMSPVALVSTSSLPMITDEPTPDEQEPAVV